MQKAREIKVGLTVLAAIVLLYLAFAWTKRMHFFAPEERTFEVHFDNVNGLLEGDPITVRGYTAGRVVSILPRSTDVQVVLTVDSRIPLFQEASAEIQVKELMGGKQIAIRPGSTEPQLSSGSVLRGSISPDFSSSFAQFGELSGNLDMAKFQSLLLRIDTFSAYLLSLSQQIDPGSLQQTLANVEQLSSDVRFMSSELRQKELVARLEKNLNQVDTLLAEGTTALTHMNATIERVEESFLPKTDTLLLTTETLLQQAGTSLDEVNQLLTALESEESILGRALYDSDLSRQVDSTLYHLNKTLEQIHSQKVYVGLRRKKNR